MILAGLPYLIGTQDRKARVLGMSAERACILLIGIGNILLTDDGVGVHVIRALDAMQRAGRIGVPVTLRDGGTIGLALLSEFDRLSAVILIDAMELGAAPGTVRAFQGAEMDACLGGRKSTAHEVAASDLLAAAQLTGCAPERRALLAIQPGSTDWGLSPTEAVGAAIPKACAMALSLIEEWNQPPSASQTHNEERVAG
jgi:hydrogenase maturation protease